MRTAKISSLFLITLFLSIFLQANSEVPYTEKIVKHGEIELHTESFGNSKDSPILFISGAGVSALMWTDSFCQALVKDNHFVIRFDNRDIGKSSLIDYAQHPYTLDDLALDAIAILDAYEIPKAHIVGQSMGGFIGQLIAINHPERILSLISLMSSPDHHVIFAAIHGKDTTEYSLPPPSKEALAAWADLKNMPTSTREERIAIDIQGWKVCAGLKGYDEEELREMAEKAYDRTRNFQAPFNQWAAMMASPSRIEKLKLIKTPTLVIHGGCDKLLPPEHGIATARGIPNSKLIIIADMGHTVCRYFAKELLALISDHTNARL